MKLIIIPIFLFILLESLELKTSSLVIVTGHDGVVNDGVVVVG